MWFCALSLDNGIIGAATTLREAQGYLGQGDRNNRQAIIPMANKAAGDPHTLPKTWDGGSMFWLDWNDINIMFFSIVGTKI